MAATLREELASLKIDRPDSVRVRRNGDGDHKPLPRRRGGGGLRVLSWILWMIPLGVLAGAGLYGYRQYDQMRPRVEVTKGLVSSRTWAEASRLLEVDGYLKSRYQAMIGTKIAGRVEKMLRCRGQQGQEGRYAGRHRAQ